MTNLMEIEAFTCSEYWPRTKLMAHQICLKNSCLQDSKLYLVYWLSSPSNRTIF
jgi:hypothetical protein